MTLIPITDYIKKREQYNYSDLDVCFCLIQTAELPYIGKFKGIFPAKVPSGYSQGINLRKFEIICRSVFKDCSEAATKNRWTQSHLENMKNIASAIVHWKMASQGGRSQINVNNVLVQWNDDSHKKLIEAYKAKDLEKFKIGGIRIPTASVFLRFLYPEDFGIIDSRVAGNFTNPHDITSLKLRNPDNYINDTKGNIKEYNEKYIPFLRREADEINSQNATFNDIDENGATIKSRFRPCDVEMALF
jgi:hypothetical protein